MFEKIRPLGDRVLLKRLEHQEKTEGGIIVPDVAKEKAQTGTVVAIGKGRVDTTSGTTIPLQVQVGDKVYFGKYSGTEAGNDHLIVREDEILGVVEEK